MKEDISKETFLSWLLNQSPAIIVLAGMSYIFWLQQERTRDENKACNQAIIQIYQDQNDQMIEALKNIEYYIQSQAEKVPNKKK